MPGDLAGPAVTGRAAVSVPLVLWLVLVWVGLWGSVTAANVLGGFAVAVVLVLLLPPSTVSQRAVLRAGPLLAFAGHFLVDLVRSSLQVAVLVVRPRLRLRQAIVAVPVPGASDTLLTLLADAISLTPGTLTLEVDRPRSTLYVHVIDVGDGPDGVEQVRAALLTQRQRAVAALGSAQAREELPQPHAGPGRPGRDGRRGGRR